jgi:UDP-N-acetylmuramoylalanine--D-glutamate ligase
MKRVLVLGLGRFGGGLGAARFLLRRGARVRVSDHSPAATLQDSIAALEGSGVEWRLEGADPAHLDGAELVVANPAVPDGNPILVAARERGVPVTQEVNLFVEHYPGRVVLVTGTNGKSSTATLLHAALAASGRDVLLGGNIGESLLAAEEQWRGGQVAVVEISSFQLGRLDPAVHRVAGAVVTPVTVDHLDRHGTLAEYRRCKSVAAAAARDFLVHWLDDAVAGAWPTPARRRVRIAARGEPQAEVCVRDGWLVSAMPEAPGPILHADALALLGLFQRENVMAAFAAAVLLGAGRHRAALACARTRPLPFRLQRLLVRDGVELFDNAVSTEVLSTLSAAQSLGGSVHWVGGGKSKDGDYARVADLLAPFLQSAHLFGAAAAPLASLLRDRVPVTAHAALEQALAAALAVARPGERVLFSPAFASFDQFANFRQRGQAFHRWVEALGGESAGATAAAGSTC